VPSMLRVVRAIPLIKGSQTPILLRTVFEKMAWLNSVYRIRLSGPYVPLKYEPNLLFTKFYDLKFSQKQSKLKSPFLALKNFLE
jgi:hypothetical protein